MVGAEQAEAILQAIRSSDRRGRALRELAMTELDRLEHFNWTGVYRLEGETLILDAYIGAETDHTRIQVGVGVCGTAVAENANQIVADVRELSNYLACSVQTRSEIVVLIRRGEKILGQIDVDGHEVGAFDASDEALLEHVSALLAERWEDSSEWA